MPIFNSKPNPKLIKKRRVVENDQDKQIFEAAKEVSPVSDMFIDRYKALTGKAQNVAAMATALASNSIPITDPVIKDFHKAVFPDDDHDFLTFDQYQQSIVKSYEALPIDITEDLSRDLQRGSFTSVTTSTSDNQYGLTELSQHMALVATAWQALSMFSAKDIDGATAAKTPAGSEKATTLAMVANAISLFASYYPSVEKKDASTFLNDLVKATQGVNVDSSLGGFINQVLTSSQVSNPSIGIGQYKAYRQEEARKALVEYADDYIIDNPTAENMAWQQYALANDLAVEENGIVLYKDGIVPDLECPFDAHSRAGNDALDVAASIINFRLTRQTACCIAAALLGSESIRQLKDAVNTLELFTSILDKAKFLLRLDLKASWANAKSMSVNRMTNWARSHIMRTAYKQFTELISKTKDQLNILLDKNFSSHFVETCPLLGQLVSMIIKTMEKLKAYMLGLLKDFLDYTDKKYKASKESLGNMADIIYIDHLSRILKAIAQLLKDMGTCSEDDLQNVISNAIKDGVLATVPISESPENPAGNEFKGFLSTDDFTTGSGIVVPSIIKSQKILEVEEELDSVGRCLADSRTLLGSGKSLAETTRTLIERVADARTQDELRRRRGQSVS